MYLSMKSILDVWQGRDKIRMNIPESELLKQIRGRITNTVKDGIQLNMSTEESKKLLRRHLNSKTNLMIMIIDINNLTQTSLLY